MQNDTVQYDTLEQAELFRIGRIDKQYLSVFVSGSDVKGQTGVVFHCY